MPQLNQPIPLLSRPKYSEGTALSSSRDDRNNSFLWKKGEQTDGQTNSVLQAVSKLSRQLRRRKPLGGGGIAGSQISGFQMVSDGGDYYNCYSFDGLTAGTTIIKVAKHQDIRCTLPSATPSGGAWPSKVIRGVTYDYTYTPIAGVTTDGVNVVEYTRGVVGSDSTSETDYITPCLNTGDIISAFQTSFSGPDTLLPVVWQAVADGRAWAAQPPPT